MSAQTSFQRRPAGGYAGSTISPQNGYWGWSHQNQRLEMMDLPAYIDSLRQTYDAALQDMSDRLQSLTTLFGASPSAYRQQGGGHHGHDHHGGHHHEHDHHEHDHHGHDHHGHDRDDCGCGCGGECGGGCKDEHDCGCDCCINDADVIVYAHCGEIRVVPIEVTNDTRRDRENVTVEISDVRTAGGTVLPWQALINPSGPVTLPACSTTKLELLVHLVCGKTEQPKGKAEGDVLRAAVAQRTETGDVDGCEVGYVTIRLGGCVVRPIVVAIAVLPDRCDAYRVGCACSCCC
ncbi:MAG: hypothetical protein QOK02_2792 [Mycobacterium sp.]|nr:hypothetical protein [Mycobacterium sp.]